MNSSGTPLWQRNYQLYSQSYPIIQLSNNIDDLVPQRSALGITQQFVPLNEWLWKFHSEQLNTIVVFYSALSGFSNPFSQEHLNRFNSVAGGSNAPDFAVAVEKIVKALQAPGENRFVVIFDQSIRWITAAPIIQPPDQRAFTALKAVVSGSDTTIYHRLIFINECSSDIPAFLLATQSQAKSIRIPKPDQLLRTSFLKYLFSNRDFNQSQMYSIAQRAEGLTLREIRTALQRLNYSTCTPNDVMSQIRLFQYGFSEDPWQQLDNDKISRANQILGEQVFGQNEAVQYATEMIQYAASGFSSVMQEDGRTAPKGVMFFCGLSGTGKTELAKAIARLVFGSADAMIRIDMGDYNQPHSAERLTGSPPGYVGHEAGGQLTEAIKEHPFSLVLFDEIEKADPSVMNKFLSILEDGRLTDGKGQTVSFENTIIVFTSNLGAAEAAHETDPARVREIISSAVRQYCQEQPPLGIGKPELYSRLAGNIVVFNPLSEEAIQRIFDNYYTQSLRRFAERQNIQVECSEEFLEQLRAFANTARDNGEFPGGRGMKKAMDKYFLTPLAVFFREHQCSEGDHVMIRNFTCNGNTVTLDGEVRRNNNSVPAPQPAPEPSPTPPPPKVTGFTVKSVTSSKKKTDGFTLKT